MGRVRLTRLFWLGAAAVLGLAALLALIGVLGGSFSDTDWKILGTLGSLLLAGGVGVSGLSLLERAQAVPLGLGAVVGAVLGFILTTAAIWDGFDSEPLARLAGTALVALVGLLLVTTGRILLREQRLLPLYLATLLALAIAVLLSAIAIWNNADTNLGKAIAAFWILGVLGWLLVPVVQRFSAAETASFRVLGELEGVELVASRGRVDGSVQVEWPAKGERLFLRRRAGFLP